MQNKIKIEYQFKCPVNVLWDLLTNQNLISKWSKSEAIFNDVVGSNLALFDGWVKGKILDSEKQSYLKFSWIPSDWQNYEISEVEYIIVSEEENSKLIILHTNFPNDIEKNSHFDGWFDFVLNPIVDYLEEID